MYFTNTFLTLCVATLAALPGSVGASGLSATCKNIFMPSNNFLEATCSDGRGRLEYYTIDTFLFCTTYSLALYILSSLVPLGFALVSPRPLSLFSLLVSSLESKTELVCQPNGDYAARGCAGCEIVTGEFMECGCPGGVKIADLGSSAAPATGQTRTASILRGCTFQLDTFVFTPRIFDQEELTAYFFPAQHRLRHLTYYGNTKFLTREICPKLESLSADETALGALVSLPEVLILEIFRGLSGPRPPINFYITACLEGYRRARILSVPTYRYLREKTYDGPLALVLLKLAHVSEEDLQQMQNLPELRVLVIDSSWHLKDKIAPLFWNHKALKYVDVETAKHLQISPAKVALHYTCTSSDIIFGATPIFDIPPHYELGKRSLPETEHIDSEAEEEEVLQLLLPHRMSPSPEPQPERRPSSSQSSASAVQLLAVGASRVPSSGPVDKKRKRKANKEEFLNDAKDSNKPNKNRKRSKDPTVESDTGAFAPERQRSRKVKKRPTENRAFGSPATSSAELNRSLPPIKISPTDLEEFAIYMGEDDAHSSDSERGGYLANGRRRRRELEHARPLDASPQAILLPSSTMHDRSELPQSISHAMKPTLEPWMYRTIYEPADPVSSEGTLVKPPKFVKRKPNPKRNAYIDPRYLAGPSSHPVFASSPQTLC
ncbi:hypothetical protein D9619_007642 [Psilocybe cf. subviscida]|uniref:F-box domain-containing protein n=1 Tax=Psilocybe cf. subviscida TaxID=2480587 RepID=A0A8H5ESH1_9AGAR|nr:hypothetical protein D9619_007642 [Psilocybe cf. subviscida]